MKNKLSKIVEIIWLITSLLCLFTAVHQTIYEGIAKSYLFFIFSLIAFAMYFLRKQLRESNRKSNSNE